jgi:hypothetical protein
MRLLILVTAALGLLLTPLLTPVEAGSAKKFAPGQRQTTPGSAKKFAPGQEQKTPGQAKTFAPGRR